VCRFPIDRRGLQTVYYRDIQAIIVRLSNRRNIWSAAFGGLAVLAAIIALVGLSVPEMVTVFIALDLSGFSASSF